MRASVGWGGGGVQEQLSEKLYGALANSKEGGFREHKT